MHVGHWSWRQRREHLGKIATHTVFIEMLAFDLAAISDARAAIRLVQHGLRAAGIDRDMTHPAVRSRQQHYPVPLIRAAGETQCQQQNSHTHAHGLAAASTTNSVPRTPMIVAGARTFIASWACFAISPETTASLPRFSEVSKLPSWVVELKLNRSMAGRLPGPSDNSELSCNVMPTEPSVPVMT